MIAKVVIRRSKGFGSLVVDKNILMIFVPRTDQIVPMRTVP